MSDRIRQIFESVEVSGQRKRSDESSAEFWFTEAIWKAEEIWSRESHSNCCQSDQPGYCSWVSTNLLGLINFINSLNFKLCFWVWMVRGNYQTVCSRRIGHWVGDEQSRRVVEERRSRGSYRCESIHRMNFTFEEVAKRNGTSSIVVIWQLPVIQSPINLTN